MIKGKKIAFRPYIYLIEASFSSFTPKLINYLSWSIRDKGILKIFDFNRLIFIIKGFKIHFFTQCHNSANVLHIM